MIARYTDHLRETMTYRRQAKIPNAPLIITIVTTCILVYILSATIIIPPDAPREYNFISEAGAITVLSALFLAMASSFSLASIVVLIRANDWHIGLWIMMFVGFSFLAFDELLQFHERVGRLLNRYADPGIFRNWDDVVVILYGAVALPIVLIFLPKLMRYRMVLEMFAIGFVFYLIHTITDSTQEPRTTVSVILEESAKLLAVEFLAIGVFFGFLGILWKYIPSNRTQNDA